MSEPEPGDALRRIFELSEVQARIYWYLLNRGEAPAREVAEACRISRGKVYALLRTLESRGLIGYVPTLPKRYRPLDVSSTFSTAERELRSSAEEVGKIRETLAKLPPVSPPAGPASVPVLIRGRRAIAEELRRFVESAKKTLVIQSSDAAVQRNLPWLAPLLRERSQETKSISLLLSSGKFSKALSKELRKDIAVREVRDGNQGLTVCVADDARVLLCRWNPDDLSSRSNGDYAIANADPAIVRWMSTSLRLIRDGLPADRAR